MDSFSDQINRKPIEQSSQQSRFSGLKILVVDDEVDSLDILTMILEQEGAALIPVKSAAAALAAFNQAVPDLIISDIGMPETDGFTLIKKIRELPQGKKIPAIALTAYANEIERQLTFDAGFQKHLAKPINIPELIAAISELIW